MRSPIHCPYCRYEFIIVNEPVKVFFEDIIHCDGCTKSFVVEGKVYADIKYFTLTGVPKTGNDAVPGNPV